MRRLSLSFFILTLALLCAARAAEEPALPPKLHPWAQFQIGSHSVVQVTTRTYNEQEEVVGTSVSDTATTLVGIDKDGVTLEIDSCVEVVGKRFDGKPQRIKQGFHGEPFCRDMKVLAASDSQVVVDDQKIPCKLQQIECDGPNGKTVTRLYYSTTLAPYVLKRESLSTDPDGKLIGRSTMEITSLEMLGTVMDKPMSVFTAKTIRSSPKGTVTSQETISPDVPGGVVSRSSREVDSSGRIVHRSVLELTEYSIGPGRHGLRPGKARARRQKASTYYEP
jgi:hypothetical protein